MNSGKSVVDFVQHVHSRHCSLHIVVVTGVVQAQAISGGRLAAVGRNRDLTLVALRVSENQYTGRGATDTGHRLFSSTRLD